MANLEYDRKNVYSFSDAEQLKNIEEYAEGYKTFLDNSKTERECVAEGIKMAIEAGFKEYALGDKVTAGDKLYYNNRGKGLFLMRIGSQDIQTQGVRILVSHVDSPRLDLKQVPLYADSDICYLKTHYYGGIKKYQWMTIPLALHGVIMLADGSKLNLKIGDTSGDPYFYISDILPHLAQEQTAQTVAKAFNAELLNVIIGGMPAKDTSVKENVLKLLNEKYNITEEDFISAELEVVPAVNSNDVGFDRAFIGGYGHDDRVCTYPEITATIDTPTDQTVITILADKEEIGSEGNTGMQCILIKDLIDELSFALGADPIRVRANSKCLSADVTTAFDPNYANLFEKHNVAYAGSGVAMNKYTGARGKSSSNDASCEYISFLRSAFARDNVIWQTGELGKVDIGGGGTVAKYLANLNIDTVDMGVPVLSMHAPYELISKADIYMAHLAFSAFIK